MPSAKKWKTLRHNGVAFPEPYTPKSLHIGVRGRKIALTPEQEEMLYAWAKKKDTPYVADEKFAENFMRDLTRIFQELQGLTMKDIDLSELYNYVDEEKNRKLNMTKEEKKLAAAERKKRREELKAKFGVAEVDGETTDIANWMVEPPGIFMGRGAHPLRGNWKPQVYPKDVTLNLGKEEPVPEGSWKEIAHDSNSMWLAKWIDKLADKEKYVWLSDVSPLKQSRDKEKYDKATLLFAKINSIRDFIDKKLTSKNERERELAAVAYIIDHLAMRVGDEKDEDEADTVGASTLRVEHIRLNGNSVEFDFLGKDSVRWQKSLPADKVNPEFLSTLKSLIKNKRPNDQIFAGVRSSQVNRFFNTAMPGLTAKVFRTFIASDVVRDHLIRNANLKNEYEAVKLYHAKLANLIAAVTCNHKKTLPAGWENSIAKKREMLKKAQSKQTKTEKMLEKKQERITKLKLGIRLAEATKEYNLNTSLKNYIDPRIFKAWSDHVGLDWTRLYTKSLSNKLSWASQSRLSWSELEKKPILCKVIAQNLPSA
ncbi:MAG: DNA topoisomerase I [Candidatus Bathyarchaeota archaeon]